MLRLSAWAGTFALHQRVGSVWIGVYERARCRYYSFWSVFTVTGNIGVRLTVMAGLVAMCIRIGVQMETRFLVLVIPVPGLDPGIAPIDGVRGCPQITSGDDEETTSWPGDSPGHL